MGGFAVAFDLVSQQYGWPDETIWDLPLARFRQITAAIQIRRYLQSRDESLRFSWLARHITHFIASGYMVDKGKENTAVTVASTLAYDDIEAALLGTPQNPAEAPPKENGNGSFERFMGMMGALDQRGKMI